MTLEEVTLNTQEKGWHRLTYDLSNWKNSQFIRFGVQGISVETIGDITAFDNFSLTDAVDYDVQIGSLTGPDKARRARSTSACATSATRPWPPPIIASRSSRTKSRWPRLMALTSLLMLCAPSA